MATFYSSFFPNKRTFATIGDLTDFLEIFIRVVLPDNGIDYWSTDSQLSPSAFKKNDPVPSFGRGPDKYNSVAV